MQACGGSTDVATIAGFLPFAVAVPSFPGIPWAPLGLTAAFCAVVVWCVASSGWARRTGPILGADDAQRWRLVFDGLCLGLLAGCTLVGAWAVPAVGAALAVATLLFIRTKDTALPEGRRVFARGGLRRLAAEFRPHVAAWQHGEAGPARSLREQVADAVANLRRRLAAAMGKPAAPTRRKGRAVGIGAAADTFTFLRKDGSAVMALPVSGRPDARAPAHMLKAQQLLQAMLRANASALSLVPVGDLYQISAQARGTERPLEKLASGDARALMAAIRLMAEITDEAARQGRGEFGVLLRGMRHRIDVETSSADGGERMLLRLHRADGAEERQGVEPLGFRPKLLGQLREATTKPYGMLLVVGPPGSGRTTTLYGVLHDMDPRKRRIMTVEAAIEQRLDDVVQIEVDAAGGAALASVLQMVVKKDPDVVMIDELADRKACEIAMQAALTGHFVLAAFEARDTTDAVVKLVGLGIEPMLVQTAVTAVLAQRIARRLCPRCRVPCEPPEALVKKFNLKPGAVKHVYHEKEAGCEHCRHTGFHGVVPIHELFVMNDQIRRLISATPSARDLKAAAALNGTLTLQIDGLAKVVHGDTTVNEILRVTS